MLPQIRYGAKELIDSRLILWWEEFERESWSGMLQQVGDFHDS